VGDKAVGVWSETAETMQVKVEMQQRDSREAVKYPNALNPNNKTQPPTANDELQTINYQLPTTNYQLPTTNYQLPTSLNQPYVAHAKPKQH
jgi:hypothetical protein